MICIGDLCVGGSGQEFAGQVVGKGALRQFESRRQGGGSQCVLSLVARDASSSLVVSLWGACGRRAAEELVVGDTAVFSNATIKPRRNIPTGGGGWSGAVSSSRNEAHVAEGSFRRLVGVEAEAWSGQFDGQQPVMVEGTAELSLMEAKTRPVGDIISIYGVVTSLSPLQPFSSSSTSSSTSTLTRGEKWVQRIKLEEPNGGEALGVSVWGAERFPQLQRLVVGRSVLLLQGVRMGVCRGKPVASAQDLTVATVDPKRHAWLGQWALSRGVLQPTSGGEKGGRIGGGGSGGGELESLVEIGKQKGGIGNVGERSFVAMVARLETGERAVYWACGGCGRKVEEAIAGDGGCGREECRKNGGSGVGCEERLRVAVTLMDHTGALETVLFGAAAERVLRAGEPLGLDWRHGWAQRQQMAERALWRRWRCTVRVSSTGDLSVISVQEPSFGECLSLFNLISQTPIETQIDQSAHLSM
ncbi:MAG: hypothetical protein Q8P67_14480 [archaeon]|nr:hypothetical protein [archaeon]